MVRLHCVIIILSAFSNLLLSQTNIRAFLGTTYVEYDDKWFTLSDQKPAIRVDVRSLLLTRYDCGPITSDILQANDLPLLNISGDRVAGCWYEVKIPVGYDPFTIAGKFLDSKQFTNVMFNILIPLQATPNDSEYHQQWYLPKIKAPLAWDIIRGNDSIIVAVIDGGTQYNHEDLDGNLWQGIGADFNDLDGDTDNDPMPNDSAKHGTSVSGIVAAKTNSDQGIAGVAGGWDGNGCSLMHFDAGNKEYNPVSRRWEEVINTYSAAKAIDSACAWGARIINMSFGINVPVNPIDSAIQKGVELYDVVFIASAGNSELGSTTKIFYPAKYEGVIAVGATDTSDIRKQPDHSLDWESCFGNELDIMAPGVNIWTTDLYDPLLPQDSLGYSVERYTRGRFAGTSASAPIVAGVAALKLSINPRSSALQIRKTLHLSADKVSAMGDSLFSWEYGYGRVNAYKAVRNLYVPSVYTHIDSTFPVIKPGQAIILERDSGRHTLDSIRLLPPHTTLEIHPGATLVIEDTIIIDSTAVIRLFSDSGIAKIEFGPNGLLEIRHPLSLKGKGVIESANILFKKDFQVEADDSLVFRHGGHFSFGPPQRVININGVVVFDSGTFVLGDSLRAIYVNSGDSARLETLPGTTLEGIPNIQAWVPSLLRSHCTEDLPCYWYSNR